MKRQRFQTLPLSRYLPYAEGCIMRVWRDEPLDSGASYTPGRVNADADLWARLQSFIGFPATMLEIAQAVLNMERVQKVLITDDLGFGEYLTK